MSWLALLLLALLLIVTLGVSRRPVSGTSWVYFRCLLPAWRFFEDVEPGPRLRFQVDAGEWHDAIAPAERGGVLLNAAQNLALAQQSLVEQLWSELEGETYDALPRLASYQLVLRLVRERAAALGLVTPNAPYRFRLDEVDGSDEPGFCSEEQRF
jgi:hypothetical protein